MNFTEYQLEARTTAKYPKSSIDYLIAGLCGESGEVAQIRKRQLTGQYSTFEAMEKLSDEIGDVLWYLSQLAHEYDLSLEDIATFNLQKLANRHR